jgi:hypothetical protein
LASLAIRLQSQIRIFSPTGSLTLAIATINAWNRLAISLRAVPGLYQTQSLKKGA